MLVIGAGIAGLTFSLKAAEHWKVTLCTKDSLGSANTRFAQGGIAGVLSKSDSCKSHIKDTLIAGRGLCNKEAVHIISKASASCINELASLGVNFDSDGKQIVLGREGGHSCNRIAHVKDHTGKAIEDVLVSQVLSNLSINVLENCFTFQLIVKNNKCLGARFFYKGQVLDVFSKATILASGGACQTYSHTTNPDGATGDGLALAYDAGADLEDIEFIQFHPTALDLSGAPAFLISEAVRGEGGILKNNNGKPFMSSYHSMADLAPRDTVAKAILLETKKTGKVFLDITHLSLNTIKQRFPTIYQTCLDQGLDITTKPIPVSPAAHYVCGGVKTNMYGETSISCLFAIGEVACTGVHGANRLASNSLLEGMVFGSRAAKQVKKYLKTAQEKTNLSEINLSLGSDVTGIKSEVQTLMWENVGLVRSEESLGTALIKLEKLQDRLCRLEQSGTNRSLRELNNLITCSQVIARSALWRTESRGTHSRADFPNTGKEWESKHILVNKKLGGVRFGS